MPQTRWLVRYGWSAERWPEGGRVFRNPWAARWCAVRLLMVPNNWDYVRVDTVRKHS